MTQVIHLSDDHDRYEWWADNVGEEGGVIFCGAGNDDVEGDAGDDFLYGEAGQDELFGGSYTFGVDPDPFSDTGLLGYWGNDYFVGGDNLDFMAGGTGNDTFEGGNGADFMYGGGGNDKFYPGDDLYGDVARGGDGNDTFFAAGNSFDDFFGGNGSDWVWFDLEVTVDLLNQAQNTGVAAGDEYFDVENLHGSFGNDTFRGTDFANILEGGSGDDTFWGRGGNDILRGGNGEDYLIGGPGADVIDGGDGIDYANYFDAPAAVVADLISTGSNTGDAAGDTYFGIENLYGSLYGDELNGTNESNVIHGYYGNDKLSGHGGNDQLWGDDGDDILYGDAGSDYLDGGAGNDWASYIRAWTGVLVDMVLPGDNRGDAAGDVLVGIEYLQGSQFHDDLRGDDLPNVIQGLDGHDFIYGRGGNDALIGHGNDTLDGGAGTDTANYASATQAVVVDLPGHIALGAEIGTDTLSGIENVTTGSGNDAVAGDGATNVLDGGAGIDTVSYYAVSSGVVLDLAGQVGVDGTSTDTLLNFENANGTAFNDAISGTAAANVLNGLGGVDTISYYLATQGVVIDLAGNVAVQNGIVDTLLNFENVNGSAGNDAISGNSGANVLDGLGGIDTVSYYASSQGLAIDLAVRWWSRAA